jgi:hypothetical protein
MQHYYDGDQEQYASLCSRQQEVEYGKKTVILYVDKHHEESYSDDEDSDFEDIENPETIETETIIGFDALTERIPTVHHTRQLDVLCGSKHSNCQTDGIADSPHQHSHCKEVFQKSRVILRVVSY